MSCGNKPQSYTCYLELVCDSLRDERNELRKDIDKLVERYNNLLREIRELVK